MYTTNELLSIYKLSIYEEDIVQLKKTIEYLQNELAEYQRVYGPLDQGDYLRRTL